MLSFSEKSVTFISVSRSNHDLAFIPDQVIGLGVDIGYLPKSLALMLQALALEAQSLLISLHNSATIAKPKTHG